MCIRYISNVREDRRDPVHHRTVYYWFHQSQQSKRTIRDMTEKQLIQTDQELAVCFFVNRYTARAYCHSIHDDCITSSYSLQFLDHVYGSCKTLCVMQISKWTSSQICTSVADKIEAEIWNQYLVNRYCGCYTKQGISVRRQSCFPQTNTHK